MDHLRYLALMSSRLSWTIANVSQNCLHAFSIFQSQSWPNFFQASRLGQYCPRVVSKFFQNCPNFFFFKIVKIVVIIMTDKSRGLSRTVLSDQLGRQRRLTLKSQPPIHKMQPISLLHFLQNLHFFFYSRIWNLTRIYWIK